MSDTKIICVNANLFFEVPADYTINGSEFLLMPQVGVGLADKYGTVAETVHQVEAVEVKEKDYL